LLNLVFKDLGRTALNPAARNAKLRFLHDPQREIDVYTSILSEHDLGTATCHGTIVEPERDRYWLFLERVEGLPLWQLHDRAVWLAVARWLARLHATVEPPGGLRLLRYDKTFYRRSLDRALAAVPDASLADLASRYEAVVAQISTAPAVFVHGEFYPANVLVIEGRRIRVCPVDWELCGLTTGLLDLAALTTGLPEAEASLLVEAYAQELPETPRDLGQLLEYCRLHLAIQWLGRSARWTPPVEHARDWAAEALAAAKRLNLVA
jgi:Ser/Thr protein kinase RdoA (MazF antagonist)